MSGKAAAISFKVCVCGQDGAGKTSWINRLKTGRFEPALSSAEGVTRVTVPFETTMGRVEIDFWDIVSVGENSVLRDGYFIGAHGLLVFFDASSRGAIHHASTTASRLRVNPTVLVAAKWDLSSGRDSDLLDGQPIKGARPEWNISRVSAQRDINVLGPVLCLLRILANEPSLIFLEEGYDVPDSYASLLEWHRFNRDDSSRSKTSTTAAAAPSRASPAPSVAATQAPTQPTPSQTSSLQFNEACLQTLDSTTRAEVVALGQRIPLTNHTIERQILSNCTHAALGTALAGIARMFAITGDADDAAESLVATARLYGQQS